ncbi:hypothetical protein D3C87_529140 [compost metagenome]
MKTSKLFLGLAALVIAFGLVFSMSAFKVKAPVVYAYTSNSHLAADIKDIDNWEVAVPGSPSCAEEGNLVCRYEFEGDMTDFQDFLELPGTTATLINSNAIAVKN